MSVISAPLTSSAVLARLAGELQSWRASYPRSIGEVVFRDARLRVLPSEECVPMGLAFLPASITIREFGRGLVVEGVPTLIAENCATFRNFGEQWKRLALFDEMKVPVVWIVNTDNKTVTVYRHGQKPTMVNDSQDLDGNPELPGFRVPVARLFE